MSLNTNLSENLKAIKERRELSLSEFADELCIARSSLQTILKGDCNLRMDTVTHISSQLNTSSLSLLDTPYSANQLHIADVLLDSMDLYMNLTEEERLAAVNLFNQLIMLLDKNSK